MMNGKKIKVAIVFAVIAGALGWLTISGFENNMQYFLTLKDVKAADKAEIGKGMRIKGYLATGSIDETPNSLEIFFTLEEEGHNLRVRYDQERPDTFKDGSEVLVEGSFTEDGYFDATMLMAKCPSKYEADEYDIANYDPATHEVADNSN